MKIVLIFLTLLFFFLSDNFGQQWKRDRHHFVMGLGASGFMGDLGGADDIGSQGIQGIRDFDFRSVRPSVMLGYRYFLDEDFAARTNLAYGRIYGNDEFTDEQYRNNRNIHFRSSVFELSVQGEYYFWRAVRAGARYRRVTRTLGWVGYNTSAYIFAGIGGFYFNSKAKFERDKYEGSIPYDQLPEDGWYDLRQLRTEGQGYFPTRDKYSPIQVTVPLGVGILFQVSRDLAIGIEYGYRKTWTDYIDDVSLTYVDPAIYNEIWNDPQKIALAEYFTNPTNNSLGENVTAPGQQRGGPTDNDVYMFTFITFYYKFPETRAAYRMSRF